MKEKKKSRLILKIILYSFLAFIGITGLLVGYILLTLPDVKYLATQNPDKTSIMEQRIEEAKLKGTKLKIRQRWVNFAAVPKVLKDAVRVSEDTAFYQHDGIDFHELKESFKKNLKEGKSVRGGSTITQQLAKNLFLSTYKSYYRKLKEFFIARQLEKHLSKDRIFSLYLNVIEFGNGIFGVEAASRYYFGKSVSFLNLEEIIRLVSVIPKPLKVSPLSLSPYVKWRGRLLLKRMKIYRYITGGQYNNTVVIFKK